MNEEVKEKEFYYKFKQCFNQFKSRHLSDYFPKVCRLIATKLFQIGLITKDKHESVVLNHMAFFDDDYFTTKHYLVGLQFLVSDIIHSDGEVYRIIYKYQYDTYTRTDIWKEKVNLAKERDNYTCQSCGVQYTDFIFPKLEAHHTTYDRVYGELIDDILILCRTCHQAEYETSLQ